MADLTPTNTVTCTINSVPANRAANKTIQRLMRMQPHIQKGLSMLARRRASKDNVPTTRAGRIWINRAKTTKLTRVDVGESFTLKLTAQIIPDLKSVEKYLDVKAG
jgi:hypothetical protein